MAAHARLKNAFTEDEKNYNLIRRFFSIKVILFLKLSSMVHGVRPSLKIFCLLSSYSVLRMGRSVGILRFCFQLKLDKNRLDLKKKVNLFLFSFMSIVPLLTREHVKYEWRLF